MNNYWFCARNLLKLFIPLFWFVTMWYLEEIFCLKIGNLITDSSQMFLCSLLEKKTQAVQKLEEIRLIKNDCPSDAFDRFHTTYFFWNSTDVSIPALHPKTASALSVKQVRFKSFAMFFFLGDSRQEYTVWYIWRNHSEFIL